MVALLQDGHQRHGLGSHAACRSQACAPAFKRGDTLFHDGYLWHSAARGTDDLSLRRHVRGSFHSGAERLEGEHLDDFVKNAAR